MKTPAPTLLACAVALLLGGCQPAEKKISQREGREAAALFSEAQFAMSMREWPRAEKLLQQAIAITPDAVFHQLLGSARVRQGNRAGAKEAYQAGLAACERAFAANKADTDPLIKKTYLLALLGRVDDARAFAKKIGQEHAGDRLVRQLIDEKKLEEFLASPTFKEIAL
jgi:tetratricopeptide (TPR) repeat protein